jgi:transcriptional regulator with XRE-family HTH domain
MFVNPFSNCLSSHAKAYSGGLTKLAEKACLSRPSLYDSLNGKSIPRPDTLERILSALNLSTQARDELNDLHQMEASLSTRRKREDFHRQKSEFVQQVGSYLLGKGFELSYLSVHQEADIIVRKKSIRIPLIALPMVHDYSKVFGALLFSMAEFSSPEGFICLPNAKRLDRRKGLIMEKYGTKIISYKTLPKILIRG